MVGVTIAIGMNSRALESEILIWIASASHASAMRPTPSSYERCLKRSVGVLPNTRLKLTARVEY
jgi:hypothetical protein